MTPDDLPANWREAYEERAAIMEFDANMTRERAEELALQDIENEMRRAGWHVTASSAGCSQSRLQ